MGRREIAFLREGQWRSRRAPGNCSRRGEQPPENTDRRVETMEARNPRSTAVNDANPRKRGEQIGAERLEKRSVFNRRRGEIKFSAKKTKKRHPNAPLVSFYSERFLGHSRSSREFLLQSWLVGGRSRRDTGVREPHWRKGRGRVVTVSISEQVHGEKLIARYWVPERSLRYFLSRVPQ